MLQNKHGKLKGNQENMCNTHESNGVSAKNQQYISSGNLFHLGTKDDLAQV